MMTKKDIKIIIGILIAAALLFLAFSGRKKGATVIIKRDGQIIGRYDLTEDRVIKIGQTNTLEITNGKVRMIHADCPDQICVKHKEISLEGESIVCLPNKIVVEIKGGRKNTYDGVTN